MFAIKKIVKKGEYLYAVCPSHPKATKNKYVLHHRVVMENFLGRILNENEVVHHINHDKHDNSIENLQVMTKEEHAALHSAERSRKFMLLTCPCCGVEFKRWANQMYGKTRSFCSRSCNAKHTRASGSWLGMQKKSSRKILQR